ncbi:costunolide synthase-like [Lactuca sativa]|uniref:costunolide synthase-like n=1 Tax=Lactuca sativa TaxID=4236 RepID=UPI0022AEB694|nr:costunolide synthase-like [Lactuca sativa]
MWILLAGLIVWAALSSTVATHSAKRPPLLSRFQNNPSNQQPPAMKKKSSMKARSKAVIEEGKTNKVAVMTIVDMFAAGIDTSSATIIWAMAEMMRNQRKDPESFIPERFENSSINFTGNDYEFIPFGAGRRMCPGITFGTNSVESTLVNLLHHFEWQLPNGMEPQDIINMEESDGITTTLKAPL